MLYDAFFETIGALVTLPVLYVYCLSIKAMLRHAIV